MNYIRVYSTLLFLLVFVQVNTISADYSKMSRDELNQALVLAVENNKADVVKELLQAGADINQEITYRQSRYDDYDIEVSCNLLVYAAKHDCRDVVHELLQVKIEIDIIDSVLIVAVTHSNLDLIKELLQVRPKIDSLDKTLNTIKKFFGLQTKVDVLDLALIVAAQNRSISIMQELILAGADINYADKNGNTALIEFVGRSLHIPWSVSRNSDYIEGLKQFRINGLEYLLSISGININHANNHGNTALMRAAENSNFEAVQILLQASNIDINHVNHDGNTALIEALQRVQTSYVSGDVNQYNLCKNSQSIVEALLKSPGIDVHHANKKGDTAIKLLDRLQKSMNGY